MLKKAVLLLLPFLILSLFFLINATALNENVPIVGPMVKKDQRKSLVSTDYGQISAVDISTDGERGSYPYHLQFIKLEPDALFLPVVLHVDMVFYVHTGSGRLSWADEDETRHVKLRKGDVYRLEPGTVFFVQSDFQRQKLRINAIFANSADDLHEPSIGAYYSSIHDLVLGFDKRILQAAFKVPVEVIEAITNGTKQPAIVHGVPKKERTFWEWEAQLMKRILGSKGYSMFDVNNKKKKTKTFNMFSGKPDFENCNGWSLTVTKKDLNALKGSNIGLFMVNLTKGSMLGPHWNPMATEVMIVLQGQGMVRVVCSSTMKESKCRNRRFRVEEGDVFAVPRFHPMAQMAFNNESLVFMGFSTTTKKNQHQFLAGKSSVLQTLDKHVLAASFNVTNTTIDQLLAPRGESIILDCTSCAEEEEWIMGEEEKKREEEEESRKREEEASRREEEEARKRGEQTQQEEAQNDEEEEQRQRQQEVEARRQEKEATRREQAAAAKREEQEREKRPEAVNNRSKKRKKLEKKSVGLAVAAREREEEF
uniref:Putative vicilin-like antimicrobial peptides 2-2 n=1 Tax=Davidia involucrata TaxID=16924 RepID=A0A5B6YM59_DAVIN